MLIGYLGGAGAGESLRWEPEGALERVEGSRGWIRMAGKDGQNKHSGRRGDGKRRRSRARVPVDRGEGGGGPGGQVQLGSPCRQVWEKRSREHEQKAYRRCKAARQPDLRTMLGNAKRKDRMGDSGEIIDTG